MQPTARQRGERHGERGRRRVRRLVARRRVSDVRSVVGPRGGGASPACSAPASGAAAASRSAASRARARSRRAPPVRAFVVAHELARVAQVREPERQPERRDRERDPEGHAQPEERERAAHHRAGDERDRDRRLHAREVARPLARREHVGNVRERDGRHAAEEALERAERKQRAERRRERLAQVADGRADGEMMSAALAVAVGAHRSHRFESAIAPAVDEKSRPTWRWAVEVVRAARETTLTSDSSPGR